jgi:hypothetical protein
LFDKVELGKSPWKNPAKKTKKLLADHLRGELSDPGYENSRQPKRSRQTEGAARGSLERPCSADTTLAHKAGNLPVLRRAR